MKKIKITRGKYTLVDDNDFDLLSKWKWHYNLKNVSRTSYPLRRQVLMHREIMNPPPGFQVDHIDGNFLNNQRKNLRICTHAQNIQNQKLRKDNTSGYKGVSYFKRDKTWRVRLQVNNKDIWIGYFSSPELAYEAYCNAAKKYFGKFARLL